VPAPCVRNTSDCFLQAQWGVVLFLMVFGMALRAYQLVCAFWEVVSADDCQGWKILCFPCISVIWGGEQDSEVYCRVPNRAESKRSESRRRRSSVGIDTSVRRRSSVASSLPACQATADPHAEPQASQYFAIGRSLSHPLYGAGLAVGNVDATFLVCFPDGSSAQYALHKPNVLPPCSRPAHGPGKHPMVQVPQG
jgi:hypothetical protein